jgi:hypothetical protein
MFLQKFKRKLQLKKEEIPSRNSKQSENWRNKIVEIN